MHARAARLCLLLLLIPPAASASGIPPIPPGMARIDAGSFRPLYWHAGASLVRLAAFAIDTLPVSESGFLAFVKRNPQWAAGRAARASETARDAAAQPAFKQRALELALQAKPLA